MKQLLLTLFVLTLFLFGKANLYVEAQTDGPIPEPVMRFLPKDYLWIDDSTVSNPESLAIIVRTLQDRQFDTEEVLDSIIDARTPEQRLFDQTSNHLSDIIGLMEVVLGFAAILAAFVGWFAKRAIDRFDDKVKILAGAESRATEAVNKIESMLDNARKAADEIGKFVPDTINYQDDRGEISPLLRAKLEEYDHRISFVETLGGALTAEEHYKRGNMLYITDRFEEALEAYDAAIKAKPDHFKAYWGKGNSLANLNRHEEAIDVFIAATRIDPKAYSMYYNMGISLAILNRHEDALSAFEATLKIKPDFAKACASRGNHLAALGRHEEALDSFNQALSSSQLDNKNRVRALTNKGIVLSKLGKHDESNLVFDEALVLKPNDEKIMYCKACAFSLLKKKSEMLEWLARSIDANTKNKDEAQTDPDFEFYRNDPDFRKLVGLD